MCLNYVFPAQPVCCLHAAAPHLSISVYVSGGRAGLGGEACQLDPVQCPGHQPPAGRDPGWVDEGHPGPGLRCQAHQQARGAAQAPDHHPNNLHHSYFSRSWDHWQHSHHHHLHHHTQQRPAAWQSAAGGPEAEQYGGGWFTSRVGWVFYDHLCSKLCLFILSYSWFELVVLCLQWISTWPGIGQRNPPSLHLHLHLAEASRRHTASPPTAPERSSSPTRIWRWDSELF